MIYAPVVFPLFPILDDGDGPRCGCGNPACGRVGKHPAIEWAELKLGDPVPRPADGAGVGIKTGAPPKGSGVFVVDVDGEPAFQAWVALNGGEEPITRKVRTGRMDLGLQYSFAYPEGPDAPTVRNSASDLAPGIDIRGDGGFVVGEGSPHKSGRRYELVVDMPPAPAPAWLLQWLRERAAKAPATLQQYDGDVTDPDERAYRRELYTSYLKSTPLIRTDANRGHGDVNLYSVVQYGAYDLALPTSDVLELVATHYDPRNDRQWGDELPERVAHKAHTAKTASTRPRMDPPPRELAHLFTLEPPPKPPPPERSGRPKSDGIVWGAWDEPIDPPQYLVHSLIPIETVGMFVAMGSSLKTWTALDIGRAVALGRPWLDRFDTRSGRVITVDFESGLYELRRRVRLLSGGANIEKLGAWSFPTERIDGEDLWKRLADIEGLGLVIVDSLAAGATGVDENDPRVAAPLNYASRFSEATGAGVLFIHHSRKDESDDRKMVRGSTAIYAACDWAYKFENVEETKAFRRMSMVCIKPCMGPKPAPVRLELSDEKGLVWFDEEGDMAKAAFAKGERTPEAVQAAIRLALQGRPIETKAKLASAVGARAEDVSRELEALVVRREVLLVKGIGYTLDGADERTARVLSLVQGYAYWKSEAAIAKASNVETSDVEELVRAGRLCRSGDGRWIVTQRDENA